MAMRYLRGDTLVNVVGVRVAPELHEQGEWVRWEDVEKYWAAVEFLAEAGLLARRLKGGL